MDATEALQFFENYVELDYQAHYVACGNEPEDLRLRHILARRELFSRSVRTRSHVSHGPIENRAKLVRRQIFAITSHKTKDHGVVWAGYVGGNMDFSADSLWFVLFVAEEDMPARPSCSAEDDDQAMPIVNPKQMARVPRIILSKLVDTDGDKTYVRSSDGVALGRLGKAKNTMRLTDPALVSEVNFLPRLDSPKKALR